MLPPPGNRGGKGGRAEKHCCRAIVDALAYIVRGGVAWAMLPVEFPPFQTVYGFYRRWTAVGAWERINDALRDRERVRVGRSATPTAAILDSQSVRGSDTVGSATRGFDAGNYPGWVVMPGWGFAAGVCAGRCG